MRLFFIFFFVFFSNFIFSQNEIQKDSVPVSIQYLLKKKPTNYDSINNVFSEETKDKELIELLIKKSADSSYFHGLYFGYRTMGRYYRDLSFFDKSLEQYKKALAITKRNFDTIAEVRILNSIGSVYRRQDAIINALNYHQDALFKARSVKNRNVDIEKIISVAQNSMGNLFISLKQYELALKEFSKSIVIQKKLSNSLGLAINYQNIGNAHEELGDLEKAWNNYSLSLTYNEQLNNRLGIIICNYRLASVLIKQEKYFEAYNKVQPILEDAIKLNDKYYLSNVYITLGLAQLYLGKTNLSKTNLMKGLEISEKYNLKTNIVKANQFLSILYIKKQNYKKGYEYFKISKEEELKIFNNISIKYLNDLTNKYDQEKKNNQIKALAKQNEITKYRLNRNNNILITTLVSLIFIGVILFSTFRNTTLQNEKKMLTLKQEALQSQMNPHFVFNALNSIKLYIIKNDKKNAVYYLNKFAKLIRKILEASKIKEVSLREELETMQLYMSIENIRFSNEIDYTFTVDPSLDIDVIKIPPLVLQPFLENAIWHGLSSKKGEKKVSLSVNKFSKEFIEIIIEDNGIGREASAKIKAEKSLKRKSIGLDLTTDRLKTFDRDFEKDFSLQYSDIKEENNQIKGTIVCIHLPLV